jgi:ribonuclease BN (tRNA processing enzyme)
MRKIPLYAPAEALERLLGYSPEIEEAFEIQTVAAGDAVKIDNTAVSFFKMAHPAETVGIRMENGDDVIGYSADTGPGGDLDGVGSGARLFICEATFQEADEEWDGHMTAAQAGRAAASAGAERLVLTHLPDYRDLSVSVLEAQKASDGIQVTLASDCLRFEL